MHAPSRCYIAFYTLQWVQPFTNSGHQPSRRCATIGLHQVVSVTKRVATITRTPVEATIFVPARLNNTVLAWSFQSDLNWRLLPYHGSTLPTELWKRMTGFWRGSRLTTTIKEGSLWSLGGKGEIRTLGAQRHGRLATCCTRPTMRPFHVEPPIGLEPTTSWLLVLNQGFEPWTYLKELGRDPHTIPFCQFNKSAALPLSHGGTSGITATQNIKEGFLCKKALVPWAGFEPARYPYQRILSPPSLPIPSPRHKMVRAVRLELTATTL